MRRRRERLAFIVVGGVFAVAAALAATAAAAGPAPDPADPAALDALIDSLLASRPPDLFGLTTVRLGSTVYDEVWREAASSPMPEGDADLDAAVSAMRTLSVRDRVLAANAWVNARIRYAPDPVLTNHHWGTLAKGLAEGRGEREDIAIAKLQLLAAAGVPRRDMFLVLVRDWAEVKDDAVLAVRDGDEVYVLGSRQDAPIDPARTERYFPTFALGSDGAWIFGRRRADAVRGPFPNLSAFNASGSDASAPRGRGSTAVVGGAFTSEGR
ncbi:MAG TPA: transglutaminase-like cysteine peptidase [Caulobacteraceae bacterium]|nr:transglutaminase-like cysteine peptidase [Caulobacteraceae bacterium]